MLLFKKLDLKHFRAFFFAPKQAFTLVELIVVISVLGVLATIAFTQISNVTLSARNSTRMTNLQSISSSLNLYIATNGVYPIPDNKTDILYSGSVIGYQGYIKDTAARILKLSANTSQDPLNTSSYFSYATNASRTDMQLLGFLEKDTSTGLKALPATFASSDISSWIPYTKGDDLGIIFQSGTTLPIQGPIFELYSSLVGYTAYFNREENVSGTGYLLQNLPRSYEQGNRFVPPPQATCASWFIAVPGNKDFNQAGFCVMKYEAKVVGGAGNSYGGHTYNSAEPIVSNALDLPINYVSQLEATKACAKIGTGYHLITNNEWMAIARDIEATTTNWSSNVVGSGYIYGGHTDGIPNNFLAASLNDNDGYTGTLDGTTSPWDNYYGNYTSNVEHAYKGQKRTLTLSNGQIIWDFSGNAWEHVNKMNTLDGSDINNPIQNPSLTCFTSPSSIWASFYNDANDTRPQCGFINGYTYENVWPATPKMNSSNGIGKILSVLVNNNVFLRGGAWNHGEYSGIYTLISNYTQSDALYPTSFRCAK